MNNEEESISDLIKELADIKKRHPWLYQLLEFWWWILNLYHKITFDRLMLAITFLLLGVNIYIYIYARCDALGFLPIQLVPAHCLLQLKK